MNIPTYFARFLKEIRLTSNQVNDLIKGHTTLRNRLEEDEEMSKIDVMGRVTDEEYDEFYKLIQEAAIIARKAIDADHSKRRGVLV